MEFIRVVLVALFLYSSTVAVEQWSWQREDKLEVLNKIDEGTLCDINRIWLCFCLYIITAV